MNEMGNALEALRMISDWAKWLVTIETFAIALLGSFFTNNKFSPNRPARLLGTAAIACFVGSICMAAVLLLSFPEIVQTLQPDTNIWLTRDSVGYGYFGLDTDGMALIESILFLFGIIFSAATIMAMIWREK